MQLFVVLVILGTCTAQSYDREIWFKGCGKSKYPDAFEDRNFPPSKKNPSIVGGKEVRHFEAPWQVSFRRGINEDDLQHFCGGLLINEEYTLTAAHCVRGEDPNEVWVVAGEHNRQDSAEQNPYRVPIRIREMISHESYGRPGNRYGDHDIALLRHERNFTFNENITAICAPDPRTMPVEPYLNDTVTVSGWGNIGSGEPSTDALYYTDHSPIQTNRACMDAFLSIPPSGDYNEGDITNNMICGGRIPELERDTCQGDSGGPFFVKRNGIFENVGITSWGFGCAAGTPGVYVRLAAYIPWVNQKMSERRGT